MKIDLAVSETSICLTYSDAALNKQEIRCVYGFHPNDLAKFNLHFCFRCN